MAITNRTYPPFRLTHFVEIDCIRPGTTTMVKGRPVAGTPTPFSVNGNVQPLKFTEIMQLTESDRTKEWIKVFTVGDVRTAKEGDSGWEADIVKWDGNEYKVMKTRRYAMGVLDHVEVYAARTPISAGEL